MNLRIYKPSFLQRILGKNYKWFYIVYYALLSESGGKLGFLSGYFATILRIVTTNYVWFLAQADKGTFTYLLVGNIYRQISDNIYYYQLSESVYSGSISSQLMRPLNFFKVQYFRAVGKRLTKNIFQLGGVLLGVTFCILTFAQLEYPTPSLILVILLIPISFSLNQFLGTIIGSVAFWIKNKYDYEGVRQSYESVYWVLIGSSIPLDKLPSGLGTYLSFSPFAWLLHHPMQIYLGKYNLEQTLLVFGGGIFWCLVLYFLAKIVFKMGLKKNESVGL